MLRWGCPIAPISACPMNLFGIFLPKRVAVLFVAELFLLSASYLIATFLVTFEPILFLRYEGGSEVVALQVVVVLISFYYCDLYQRIWIQSRIWLLQQLSLAFGISFFAQALASYFQLTAVRLPNQIMIFGSGIALLFTAAFRIFYGNYVLKRLPGDKVLMVGYRPVTGEIARYFQTHPEVGFQVCGFVDSREQPDGFASYPDLHSALRVFRPDLIVVGVEEPTHMHIFSELLDLKYRSIRIERSDAVYERVFGRVQIRDVTISEMLFEVPVRSKSALTLIQTGYSMLAALAGLVLVSPLLILIAVAVKVTSRGPVLFRQSRVGLNGRVFTIYKFRSMYEGVDAVTGPVTGDPRITPLGRYLRKLRLDELPQFWNLMRGDMHLVGPRPEIPALVQAYTQRVPLYQQRLLVKPGITGWAQINHKAEETLEDTIQKLGYDLYYIRNMSMSFDSWIIFHTLKTMLLSRGAR